MVMKKLYNFDLNLISIKKMKKITLLVVLLFFGFQMNAQGVVINEIITSNSAVITDDDGSYEDWVELYNTSSTAINLQGYGLSDLSTNPFQWVFPEYWMEPGEHLLIWCSDKNRTDVNFPLHTNFKISSSGETITLTNSSGVTVDSYPAVVIPQNYTYGRQTDGSPTLVIFPEPTPGESNTTPGFSEVLTAPTMSVAGGFYTAAFPLTISHADPAVTIVYTTDGSDPELSNLAGTTYNYKNKYLFNGSFLFPVSLLALGITSLICINVFFSFPISTNAACIPNNTFCTLPIYMFPSSLSAPSFS